MISDIMIDFVNSIILILAENVRFIYFSEISINKNLFIKSNVWENYRHNIFEYSLFA